MKIRERALVMSVLNTYSLQMLLMESPGCPVVSVGSHVLRKTAVNSSPIGLYEDICH